MGTKFGNWLHSRIGIKLQSQKKAVLLEIVTVFGIGLAFIFILVPLAKRNQFVVQGIVWVANIIMIFLVWLGQWFRKRDLGDFGLTWPRGTLKSKFRLFLWSLLVFILSLFAFILGSVLMSALGITAAQADMGSYAFLKNNPVIFGISLIGVFIVSSFGEELIYRGFLIQRISSLVDHIKYQKVVAVITSAVIFGLVHYQWGITGMVQTTFMGLVLGTCYILLKNRLVILILAHAYMDALLLFSIYFN